MNHQDISKLDRILTHLDIDAPIDDRMRRETLVQDILPSDDNWVKMYDSRLASRLLGFSAPYKRQFILAIVLMIFSALASVAGPWIIGRAIDDGIRAGSLLTLRTWIAIFVVVALFEWVTNRARMHIMAIIGTQVVADIRSTLFRHLHTLSLNFYNQYSVGRLMSRLLGDVETFQEFITWSITGLARAVFILVGIAVAMTTLNWQLTLVTFTVIPLMVAIANYWRKHARAAYVRTRSILSHINGYLNESISGIRVTKSFSREQRNSAHFNDLNLTHFESMMRAELLSALFFPAIEFVSYLTTAMIVVVGGFLVVRGGPDGLTAGTLVAFVLYIGRFFDPIRELAQRLNTFQATMASSERIFRLLDTEPEIQDAPDAVELPNLRGHVLFDDVRFSYKEDESILRGITLEAQPGERIALVGETGAGKSTIIRLLARFFELDSGRLLIDDVDIRDIRRSSLRRQLGIVLQDTFLFSGSIMDNIRYGRLEASDDEVIAAAQAVGAHDFIMRMAHGYATDVGENGVNLSVGQRQIVSFARALLADPRILVLDEATSSVDTATEKIIQQAIDTLMHGRTSFVIAHRLSTIVSADKIVVLDHGQIIEMGSHEELLALHGRYYNLYTMQWAAQQDGTVPDSDITFNIN